MSREISAKFLTFFRCLNFSEIYGVNMVLNLCLFVVTALFCRAPPAPATCTQPPIGGYFWCLCVCVCGGGLLMSQTTESAITFSFTCRLCGGKATFRTKNEGAAFAAFTTQAERFSYLSVSWSEAGITNERGVQTPHSLLRRYTAEVQRGSKGNFHRIARQMHTPRTQLLRTSCHKCLPRIIAKLCMLSKPKFTQL